MPASTTSTAMLTTTSSTTKPAAKRATYAITVRAEPNVDDVIRALRAVLKSMLRSTDCARSMCAKTARANHETEAPRPANA